MWPGSTYYFPPTMQPIHEALPEAFSGRWQAAFGKGVARAFDARGWAYFSRDVFDLFYPGYGDSWPTFQGAVGMTFEMAGQGGLAYKREDGEILTLESRIQRHTAASLAIASGADVKVVQQMLGHKTATMTLDLYGHLYPDRLDDVAERLDAAARDALVYSVCTKVDIVDLDETPE